MAQTVSEGSASPMPFGPSRHLGNPLHRYQDRGQELLPVNPWYRDNLTLKSPKPVQDFLKWLFPGSRVWDRS